MGLENEIRAMYREIVEYQGNFGDPIDWGADNPFDLLREQPLSDFELTGVCVAALCFMTAAIDNATYESAVSTEGKQVKAVLREGLCSTEASVREAFGAFLESEAAFYSALDRVYREVVAPHSGT